MPVERRFRPPHLLGLRPRAGTAAQIVADLARDGVYVAERGGVIRVGAHIYNDEADVSRFATTLAGVVTGTPRARA